ncbi:MAG: RnfH family protein [Gammaproteobacteria bacterium]|nr:RnfH family protein [Gammaproteobacteria bacterium]
MKCSFAVALPSWQGELPLTLESGATVEDLLRHAQPWLARHIESAGQAAADETWWREAPVGIFGERCDRSRTLAEGDRVELYLPLKVDPKAARRQRAQPHQTDKGRNPLTRKPGR